MRLLAPLGLTLILSTIASACNSQAALTTGPTVPAATSTPVPGTLAPALSLPKAGMVAFVIETGATNRLIYIDQSGIHEMPMAVADATLGNPAVAGSLACTLVTALE